MTISKTNEGAYVINSRKAGPEAAAFGAGFAPDLNADGTFAGVEGGVEVASGGVLTYAIYTAVLATLDTIPAVREGRITRGEQRQIVLDRTWQVTKGSVPTVVILGAVLAVCPWAAPIAGLAGLIGGGVMATRIVRAACDAMPEKQRDELKSKAQEVGVNLKGITDEGPEPTPEFS